MRCSSRPDPRRRLLLHAALAGVLLPLTPVARAENARVAQAELIATPEGYVLDAEIDFDLNPRLEDAISRGVAMYFLAEFQLTRYRRYWFDEVVVQRTINYRLSYHALTRRYRLSYGALHQNFDSLDAAVRTMQRIRNWLVTTAQQLEPDDSYTAALRFRIDTTQLPKPFQVTALGSRDWDLDTDWLKWPVTLTPARETE